MIWKINDQRKNWNDSRKTFAHTHKKSKLKKRKIVLPSISISWSSMWDHQIVFVHKLMENISMKLSLNPTYTTVDKKEEKFLLYSDIFHLLKWDKEKNLKYSIQIFV